MTDTALSTDMKTVELIVRGAAPLLLSGLSSSPDITTKTSTTDVTTNTDFAIQAFIVDALQEHFPDDGILAEEDKSIESKTGRRWIIDPLDGTSNFVRGLWPSVISIGLESDGEFVGGVVFDPVLNELFSAFLGNGAFLNGQPMSRTKNTVNLNESFVSLGATDRVTAPNFRVDLLRQLAIETDAVRDLGSTALQICYVAAGRYDAHIVLGVSIWDVAAGFVIAKEAGCLVEGFQDGTAPNANSAIVSIPSLMKPLQKILE